MKYKRKSDDVVFKGQQAQHGGSLMVNMQAFETGDWILKDDSDDEFVVKDENFLKEYAPIGGVVEKPQTPDDIKNAWLNPNFKYESMAKERKKRR